VCVCVCVRARLRVACVRVGKGGDGERLCGIAGNATLRLSCCVCLCVGVSFLCVFLLFENTAARYSFLGL